MIRITFIIGVILGLFSCKKVKKTETDQLVTRIEEKIARNQKAIKDFENYLKTFFTLSI